MLSLLTLTLAFAAAEPIHVEERRAFSVVLLAPLGELSVIDASAVIAGLSLQLNAKTDLEVEALEPERAADCAGELACLIERTGARTPLFLVLSAVKAKSGDRISATLVDVAIARADMNDERAVLLRPEWTDISTQAELERWIADLIGTELRPMLEKRDAWEPFGAIAIEGVPAGAAIALDGVTRGVARDGTATLAGVKPGKRTISFEHAKLEPVAIVVDVHRGETTRVSPVFVSGSGAALREMLFWTGAGTAAIGAGIVVYALARADSNAVLCLSSDPASSSCSTGGAFHRSNSDTSGPPDFDRAASSGGVALAPLGYSILATGALWAIGAWVLGEEDEAPWIALLAGVGAGAFSFGLSVSLDGAP